MTKSASAGMGSPPSGAIMAIRWPASAPAKLSSGSPSGSGITAATVFGGTLFDASGEMTAPSLAPGEFITANQIFSLVGVRFARPGHYKFVLNVGDAPPHETPLRVIQAPAAE